MAIHNGSATMNTTNEASKSAVQPPRAGRPPAPPGGAVSFRFVTPSSFNRFHIASAPGGEWDVVHVETSRLTTDDLPRAILTGGSDWLGAGCPRTLRSVSGRAGGQGQELLSIRIVSEDIARLDLVDPAVQLQPAAGQGGR